MKRGAIAAAALCLMVAGASGVATAGPKLVFENAGIEVDLVEGSRARIAGGVMTVECMKDGDRCRASYIGGGPVYSDPPVVTLTCSGCSNARIGAPFTLSWTSIRAAICVTFASGMAFAQWDTESSEIARPPSGSLAITPTRSGTATLYMLCYGDGGESNLSQVALTVSP